MSLTVLPGGFSQNTCKPFFNPRIVTSGACLFGRQTNNASISKNLNINLNKRPEELSHETFYRIAEEYEKLSD